MLLLCPLSLLYGAELLTTAQPVYSHYTIEATFDPQRHTLSGQQTVEYVNDSDKSLDAIYFELLPNYEREPNPHLDPSHGDASYPQGFDPAYLRVHTVTDIAGNPLPYELLEAPAILQTYSRKDTLLQVALPEPLAPGAQTKLIVRFTTKFPHTLRGDEGYYRQMYTWRFGWNPVAVAAHELIDGEYISEGRPYYPRTFPAALYELTLTLPKGYQAAIGADHQEVIQETEKERTIHALSAAPVRSVPLSLSPEFRVYEFPDPQISILVYYLPGHEAAARLIASYAAESLEYYRTRWGAYPHRRLLLVETASVQASFSGAAGNAMVLINRQFFDEKDLAVPGLVDRLLDYLIAHEVAHQWWGIGIGMDLNAENFLSESFAQYFSITYFEEKYGAFGPNVFQLERDGILERFVKSQFGYINLREHMQGELPYMLAVRNQFDEAIVKPQQDVEFANFTVERLYNKGYLMLRALRGIIGSEAMDRLLVASYGRFLHGTATVEEFEALVQEISGQDLEEFFTQALHRDRVEEGRAPYVDYEVAHVDSRRRLDGTYEHIVYLVRRGDLRMPVEVVAVSRAGEEQKQIWKVEDQEEGRFVMVFDTSGSLAQIRVDPQSLTPDIDRWNNYYVLDGPSIFHRKIRFLATGENALPLDAYLIRFNPFYQVLEGGYLLDHRWWLGPGFGAFIKDLGRGSSVGALAELTDGGLLGQVFWRKLFYSSPEIGFLGRFWEATDELELSYLHRPDSTGFPSLDKRLSATGRMANVFSITWFHQEALRQRLAWWVSMLNDPDAFTRIEIGGWQGIRLAPKIQLGAHLALGWSQGNLGIFHFDLRSLISHDKAAGYPYVGSVRMLGQLDLTLPFQQEMGYNLLNVALLHQIDERFFLRFGNTWENAARVDLDLARVKMEIGAEITLSGRTLGGLFAWAVRLGLVYPLSELDESERQIKQYLEISIPFL
jgi:hypothetical protein